MICVGWMNDWHKKHIKQHLVEMDQPSLVTPEGLRSLCSGSKITICECQI